jgi:2-succinyl-6-hydroxy-2,4-cyclohexadiene-1-carboxylate synthase
MGGRLALHIACALATPPQERPDEIQREVSFELNQLIVIGASLGLTNACERMDRVERDRTWSDALWEQDTLDDFLEAWQRQPLLTRLTHQAPEVSRSLLQHRRHHDPRGIAIAFESLGLGVMPPLHDQVARLRHAVFWFYGEEDPKYQEIAQQARLLNPLIQVVEVPKTGHSPHLEDFDQFWIILSSLLS